MQDTQRKAAGNLLLFHRTNKIFWHDNERLPKFIKGVLSNPSTANPEEIAVTFLKDNHELFDMPTELREEVRLVDAQTDATGAHHVSLAQFINGVSVYEGSIQVHMDPTNET